MESHKCASERTLAFIPDPIVVLNPIIILVHARLAECAFGLKSISRRNEIDSTFINFYNFISSFCFENEKWLKVLCFRRSGSDHLAATI